MKLVGDITFIATGEGWLYLATWLDLATREIVGYSMADHHRASLVVDALTMAAGRGGSSPAASRTQTAAASTHPMNFGKRYVGWGCGRAWAGPVRASTMPPPNHSSRC